MTTTQIRTAAVYRFPANLTPDQTEDMRELFGRLHEEFTEKLSEIGIDEMSYEEDTEEVTI